MKDILFAYEPEAHVVVSFVGGRPMPILAEAIPLPPGSTREGWMALPILSLAEARQVQTAPRATRERLGLSAPIAIPGLAFLRR